MMTSGSVRAIVFSMLQIGIGAVWIAAAVGKTRTPAAIRRDSVRRLLGGPAWMVTVISRVLPAGEFAIGLMLIAGLGTTIAATISAILFFLFAVLIGRATINHSLKGVGCGCFGMRRSSGQVEPLGPKIVARNFLLGNLALIVALGDRCACSR